MRGGGCGERESLMSHRTIPKIFLSVYAQLSKLSVDLLCLLGKDAMVSKKLLNLLSGESVNADLL
jgi:hypothetical protein